MFLIFLVNPHSSSDSEVSSIELELRSRLRELWAIPEEFEIAFTRERFLGNF